MLSSSGTPPPVSLANCTSCASSAQGGSRLALCSSEEPGCRCAVSVCSSCVLPAEAHGRGSAKGSECRVVGSCATHTCSARMYVQQCPAAASTRPGDQGAGKQGAACSLLPHLPHAAPPTTPSCLLLHLQPSHKHPHPLLPAAAPFACSSSGSSCSMRTVMTSSPMDTSVTPVVSAKMSVMLSHLQ